jgi:hypothetical protein
VDKPQNIPGKCFCLKNNASPLGIIIVFYTDSLSDWQPSFRREAGSGSAFYPSKAEQQLIKRLTYRFMAAKEYS